MNKKSVCFKNLFVLLSVFCLFILFSCTNQSKEFNYSNENEKASGNSSQTGFLALNFNSFDAERTVIPVSDAMETASLYEIVLYNASGTTKYTYDENETTIEVPTGNWNLVILAGQKASSKGYLVGSGYSDEFTIVENQITDLTVKLLPVDITLTAPEEVFCKESFSVGVSIDTRNPHLLVSYVNLSCVSSGALNFEKGQIVSNEKNYTAPSEPADLTVKFTTCGIYLFNETTGTNDKLDTCSSFDRLINSEIYENDGITVKSISAVKKVISTGMNMNVSWDE